MRYIYGDSPSKNDERAIKKKIAHIAEAQNCMAEALSRGNLNQVGRSAWGSMIDLIQEMVVDEINDAIVECDDEKADALNTRLQEIQRTEVKTLTIPAKQSAFTIENVYQGGVPSKL